MYPLFASVSSSFFCGVGGEGVSVFLNLYRLPQSHFWPFLLFCVDSAVCWCMRQYLMNPPYIVHVTCVVRQHRWCHSAYCAEGYLGGQPAVKFRKGHIHFFSVISDALFCLINRSLFMLNHSQSISIFPCHCFLFSVSSFCSFQVAICSFHSLSLFFSFLWYINFILVYMYTFTYGHGY